MSRRARHQRRRRSKGGATRVVFLALGVLATGGVIGVLAFVGWVVSVANSAPPLDTSKAIDLGETSRVYAADGTRLGFIQADTLRTEVTSRGMPRQLRQATVAVEDRRFFTHQGVDFEGVVRAAVQNVTNRGKRIQGGSTLTMQLVRNLYTGDDTRGGIEGYKRKIREAKLAQELEDIHTGREGKEWILTKYLNSVPYGTVGGQTAVGVQAAARIFFDKPASELKLHESALLAGLPQAPSQYNPFLDADAAKARRDAVLSAMARQDYITEEQAAEAQGRKLGVKRGNYYRYKTEGYFFDYVRKELIDRYGEERVRQGGLRVDTTINLRLQRLARRSLEAHLGDPNRAAALVAMDPRTGQIKAMASTAKYGTSKFNLAAQGKRQPGSTFKTMALVTALNQGVSPNTTYVSKKLEPGWYPAAPDWAPKTFSNTYRGTLTLTGATLASDNSVYAQLAADVGPEKVAETAKQLGITSKLNGYAAEALGGLERGVSPLEMSRAYATIANGGWRMRPIAITRVKFRDGKTEDLSKPRRHKAFKDGVMYEATKILKQNIQEGTGVRAQIGCPAAGKTGTTDLATDAWFAGFTPRLSTVTWLGHPKERISMGGMQGGQNPAEMWHDFMIRAKGDFCGDFKQPKQPFQAQPFYGKYSRGQGPNGTPQAGDGTGTQTPPPTQPQASAPSTQRDAQANGAGTGNGGSEQFDPAAYESPPQAGPSAPADASGGTAAPG
jgi:penicillin-binding protein 1A